MDNVRIISTSHIAQESIDEIKKEINEWDPDIVAVELDYKRLNALARGERTKLPLSAIRRIGILGYLFAQIGGYVQRHLGGMVGVIPGHEMLTGVQEAGKKGKEIFLIDQDIEVTLNKLSGQVPASEKLKMLWMVISGFFKRGVKMEIDLRKVPSKDLVKKLTKELEEKFPNMHRVLVNERNELMARNVRHLAEKDSEKKVLVVVGAGHAEGIKRLLRNINK